MKWIKCCDRIPEVTIPVLVYGDYFGIHIYRVAALDPREVLKGVWNTEHGKLMGVITHWMPLPELPNDNT